MMLSLQFKLKQSCLLEPSTFKSFNLAKNFQTFILTSDDGDSSFIKGPIQDQKDYINSAMKKILKQVNSLQQKIWIKLLFIDTLFTTCRCDLLTRKLGDFLTEICNDINTELHQFKSQKLSKDNSFTQKLSSSIFKIKSMMSISTPKSLSTIPQTPSTSKQLSQEQIVIKLLESILSYQREKLQLFDFVISIRQKYQKNQPIFKENQSFESIVESVWMIINFIKSHSMIAKAYKKIAFVSDEIKPFMVAMIVRLCKDSIMFYPYVAQSIEIGTLKVTQKYDKIISQRLPKEIKKIRLQNLSQDSEFVEVDNLISELSSINETIFYLFCGKEHFMHVDIQIPKKFFLNTTNQKLDYIHSIIKEVHHAAEKKQKSKLFISQMVQKLDQSVSKVLEKERLRKSVTNIVRKQKFEEQYDPNIQERDFKKKHIGIKLSKKKSTFFEEITEEV